jgi:chromosome condensin MukBEF ATPase and DNA-binding subunit MukB
MNTNENPIGATAVVETMKPKTAKVKTVKTLNKETSKVLGVIVKNPALTATKIQKKLRFNFVPTRALSFLRKNKFVLVNKTDKTYSVSAAGTESLAGYVAPKRKTVKTKTAKARKVKTAPVVAAEPIAEPIMPEVAPVIVPAVEEMVPA